MTAADAVARSPLALIGHLSEYGYLLSALDAQPGLHPLLADPFSGTTGILLNALGELALPAVYVDARPTGNQRALALAVADAAVAALRPKAMSWWRGSAPASDLEGTRLRRDLAAADVEVHGLRLGRGLDPAGALDEALRLAKTLAGGPVLVALDHLDDLLRHQRAGGDDALATLRTARQRYPELQLLLVGRPDGPIEVALHDGDHPLYRAGQPQHIRRTAADRFTDDLLIGKPWLPDGTSVNTVTIVAELVGGVPAYVWQIITELAAAQAPPAQGWERYCHARETQAIREAATLGALHPLAVEVMTAIATGAGAYSIDANDARVRAALQSLRSVGAAWQPRPREWALADPLVAWWVRRSAPHRRAAQ